MGSKPGRPPTAGTRHGTGKGHGGPAKGASKAPASIQAHAPFSAENQPEARGAPGKLVNYRSLSDAERLLAIREAQWGDAFDPELPARDRHAARIDLQNRLGGLPVATVVTNETPLKKLPDGILDRAIDSLERALGGTPGDAEVREDASVVGKTPGIL